MRRTTKGRSMKQFKLLTNYRAEYFANNWLVLCDDDQKIYVAGDGLLFVFIEIIDMPCYCGRDAKERWVAEVSMVNIGEVSPSSIVSAVQYMGFDEPPDMSTKQGMLMLAEALYRYGCKAFCWSDSSGNPNNTSSDESSRYFTSLRAAARREAESILKDESLRETYMNKTVNKAGHTAREYMAGGDAFWAPFMRTKMDPERATDEQKILLKMYSKCERMLGGEEIPKFMRD
jgi:hypothetical protein